MSDPSSRYPNRNRSPKHQPHRRLPECWVQASLPNLTARNGEAEGANGAKRVGDRKKMSHRTRATDQENRGYQHIRMHQRLPYGRDIIFQYFSGIFFLLHCERDFLSSLDALIFDGLFPSWRGDNKDQNPFKTPPPYLDAKGVHRSWSRPFLNLSGRRPLFWQGRLPTPAGSARA